jgi:hypothetical protein
VATDLPWMKFYPRDWATDSAVRSVSLAARGLWVEMLFLMHQNDRRRGYLDTPDGGPMSSYTLARLVGSTGDEVIPLLTELEAARVFSRDEAGVIYSRRIARDCAFRERCSAAGKKGGGNPGLKGTAKGSSKGGRKGTPKVTPKPQSTEYREKDIKDIAGLAPGEPTIQTPEKKDRPRNPLFDAVSEVTGADAKLVGSLIGKVSAALAEAGYGPDDVRDFGRRYLDLCPWARGERTRPEPAELQKHIGKLRAAPAVAPAKPVDVSNLF